MGDDSQQARRVFSTVVGVDLGGGKGKNTAVALLQPTADGAARVCFVGTKNPQGKPFYDSQLIEFIERLEGPTLLAIDAPLSRTACVRCQLPVCKGLQQCDDPTIRWFREEGRRLVEGEIVRSTSKPPTTPYTQRACEVVLHRRHGIVAREALGQGTGPLTARAHYLRRALESCFVLNENLLEVYPKATIQRLFGAEKARRYKRQVNTWRTRAEMLEALGDRLRFEVWREGCLSSDHFFDALICAFTGFLWAAEGWTMPSEHREVFEEDGWIWFPPPPE
jgi:hypothetical protein